MMVRTPGDNMLFAARIQTSSLKDEQIFGRDRIVAEDHEP